MEALAGSVTLVSTSGGPQTLAAAITPAAAVTAAEKSAAGSDATAVGASLVSANSPPPATLAWLVELRPGRPIYTHGGGKSLPSPPRKPCNWVVVCIDASNGEVRFGGRGYSPTLPELFPFATEPL